MRALTACLAFILSVGFLASVSHANITVTKDNPITTPITLNGASTNVVFNEFTSANFGGSSTAEIINLELTVSFTKLRNIVDPAGIYPFYNEIQMVLSRPGLSTTLIAAGAGITSPTGINTFQGGGFGTVGFDGVVVFSTTATREVNFNPISVPNSLDAGGALVEAFKPAGLGSPGDTVNNPWTFNDASALGVWTLTVSDVNGTNTVVSPLVVRSASLSITAVPEPSSFGLCGLLTLGGAFTRRRRA
jgi:hypothetical protein